MKVNIGKNTLGGGKRMVTSLNNYRRSTHDLSFICRTSMAPGVLVPTLKLLMEPGDTFEIETRCHTLTHPTVGPLFGSFKQQNDFFFCPIRLYNAMLHNNTLNIGLNMSQVKLPIMTWDSTNWKTSYIEGTNDTILKQVHPSSLLCYLGYKTLSVTNTNKHNRQCVPVLAYYDIFKNYYANKQEEKFYTVKGAKEFSIGTPANGAYIYEMCIAFGAANPTTLGRETTTGDTLSITGDTSTYTRFALAFGQGITNLGEVYIDVTINWGNSIQTVQGELSSLVQTGQLGQNTIDSKIVYYFNIIGNDMKATMTVNQVIGKHQYNSYPLTDIDETREAILASGRNQFIVSSTNAPYIADLLVNDSEGIPATASPLTGLCLKTYQSDINTNWVNTEWIEGENGINEITAIDTSSGSFTIDQLNLASKVYKMLNRIAVSDGSYNAWIQTVFTAGGLNHIETPLYLGGSSLEIEFQEVISNSATADEPLGSYAGRGVATNKKGGHIRFKADEPGYIMCITSITPRVDYYQGHDWDISLQTLDDLHKPQLDAIGFQDRLYKDINASSSYEDRIKSIGKQPSWINYMTNVNKTYGNFAIAKNEGWMCLNRVFEGIDTYTTYVQPHLYNNIFAETEITAQNFWVQIGFDIKARRVMSAKQIPNL